MGKKEFAVITLNLEYETFAFYVTYFSSTPLNTNVHLFHRAQIAGLIAKKPFTKIFARYVDFTDIFSWNLASKLPKHIGINNYTIKLVDNQ